MLSSSVGGILLDCCIYNASGPRTGSIEALQKIAESKSGAVLSKSATLVEQTGNALPRFVNKIQLGGKYAEGSLNSEGLPNYGVDYYVAPENILQLKSFSKPYIVSISGHTIEDNLEMLTRIYNTAGVSGIELNFACPNVPGKPMVAYDYDQLDLCLSKVCNHPQFGSKPLGVKLAPYFDIPHFQRVADILAKYPIKFIVSVNSIPNGLIVDFENECEAIAPKQGLGGLAGGFIKHTALANVRTLFNLLKAKQRSDIDIVGVGGISTGQDAFEMILCGAKAVQIGTCHWTEGASCFERIAKELQEVMRLKGYHSIEEFRGNLKPFIRPSRQPVSCDAQKEAAIDDNDRVKQQQIQQNNQLKFDAYHKLLIGVIFLLLAFILKQMKE